MACIGDILNHFAQQFAFQKMKKIFEYDKMCAKWDSQDLLDLISDVVGNIITYSSLFHWA